MMCGLQQNLAQVYECVCNVVHPLNYLSYLPVRNIAVQYYNTSVWKCGKCLVSYKNNDQPCRESRLVALALVWAYSNSFMMHVYLAHKVTTQHGTAILSDIQYCRTDHRIEKGRRCPSGRRSVRRLWHPRSAPPSRECRRWPLARWSARRSPPSLRRRICEILDIQIPEAHASITAHAHHISCAGEHYTKYDAKIRHFHTKLKKF